MNHRSRRKSLPAAALCLIAFAAIALTLAPAARAQFTGKSAATVEFESNSNVFDLNSGAPVPQMGDPRRGDTFFAYGARFDLEYLLGRQQFFATASTTEFNYQRHTDLTHDDYHLESGLNWKLTQLLDGRIDITRLRAMVPFYDLQSTTLSVQTQQREEATVGIKVTPVWRVEGDVYTSKLDQPIPQAPNQSLTESSGRVEVKYSGLTRLTGGFYAGYMAGSYEGTNPNGVDVGGVEFAANNPDYHQYTGGLSGTFLSPRSTFQGQLGYSRRTSSTGTDDTSGVTGQLSLKEQLTVKSSLLFEAGRSIQSYVLTSGSEIDSSLGVTAQWQATYKLAVTLAYKYIYRDYPGQGNNPVGSERVDIQNSARLELDYQPRQWLLIKPYANLQWRLSNFIGGAYDSNIFGVSVTVQTSGK